MLKPIAFPRTRDRRLAALLSVLNTLRDDLSAEYGPVEADILFLGDGFCECRVRPAQPTAKMAGKNSPGKNAEARKAQNIFIFACIFSMCLLKYLIGTSLRCARRSAIRPRGGEWNE